MESQKKRSNKESRQILPASQAFQALFVSEEGDMISKPVICWLVKDEGEGQLEVEGMVAGEDGICACNDDTFAEFYFVDYCGPGENPAHYSSMANAIARSKRDEDDEFDDFDDFEDYDEDEYDLDPDFNPFEKADMLPKDMMKNLPIVLSQISVLVREQLEHKDVPEEWKEWLGFMTKFSHLTEDDNKTD
mgnify:CR=1 FL=1